jgi:hypothetical protein
LVLFWTSKKEQAPDRDACSIFNFIGHTNDFGASDNKLPYGKMFCQEMLKQVQYEEAVIQCLFVPYFAIVVWSADQQRLKQLGKNCLPYDLAGLQSGPIAINNTIILMNALEAFPDAIEPELSKTNQDKTPVTTVLRTGSGALSYTHADKHQTITPQPNKKPPVNADKNLVVGS